MFELRVLVFPVLSLKLYLQNAHTKSGSCPSQDTSKPHLSSQCRSEIRAHLDRQTSRQTAERSRDSGNRQTVEKSRDIQNVRQTVQKSPETRETSARQYRSPEPWGTLSSLVRHTMDVASRCDGCLLLIPWRTRVIKALWLFSHGVNYVGFWARARPYGHPSCARPVRLQ